MNFLEGRLLLPVLLLVVILSEDLGTGHWVKKF